MSAKTRPHSPESTARRFAKLQRRLLPIWQALETSRPVAHTSVVVPSLSFHKDELAKIQGVSFYEERLLFSLIRLRNPQARVIYITSQPIHPEIIDYYLALLPTVSARNARGRLQLFSLYDGSPEPLSKKILDRPRFVQRIRDQIPDPKMAYLTCFSSSPWERELAVELDIPLNGVDPNYLWLGSKSGSRHVFREAGIEVAPGFEDLKSKTEILDALVELKNRDPRLSGAVVKLNESFAGAGNAIFKYPRSKTIHRRAVERAFQKLTWASDEENLDSFLTKFESMGGIVEAFVEESGLKSPSVQLRINPDGSVSLISTHDQVLGGVSGQTYLGCRFPCDDSYRELIQDQGLAIGRVLQKHGVVSRFAIDFLVYPQPDGTWRSLAVEINLRMGGTTPPFLALQFLTGGGVDDQSGHYRTAEGGSKFYYATDNLRSPSYKGLLPDDLISIMMANDVAFDPAAETGAVFHMIGALSQFGKVGVTCIGDSRKQAEDIYRRIVDLLDRQGEGHPSSEDFHLHPFEAAALGME